MGPRALGGAGGDSALTPSPTRAASPATFPSWTLSLRPCGSSCFLPIWPSVASCSWPPGEPTTCCLGGRGRGRGRSRALHGCLSWLSVLAVPAPLGALGSLQPPSLLPFRPRLCVSSLCLWLMLRGPLQASPLLILLSPSSFAPTVSVCVCVCVSLFICVSLPLQLCLPVPSDHGGSLSCFLSSHPLCLSTG